MKTTKRKAKIIYKIVKNINLYDVCDIDIKEYIKELKSYSLEINIKQLKNYIKENEINIIDNNNILKMYSKLI